MAETRHEVMEEFRDRPIRRRDAGERDELRRSKPLDLARSIVEHTARRVEASRKLLARAFFRGDCHSHSQHSDGIGTVAETAEMARAAGLDFQWVTDHWGLTQSAECRSHGLWVGQEPGTEHHHLGILGLDRTFTPSMQLANDYARIVEMGGTPYIPHPAGWWPATVYTAEQKNALRLLPDGFMMEVINGAGNLATAYDYTDAAAVALWDELLCDGRHVHGMGNTDAHSPNQIGIVWNGVYAPRCDEASILQALRTGRSFASEAPVLDLRVGRTAMGGVIRDRATAGPLTLRVADAAGLLQVRIVADGKVRRRWHPDGQTLFAHEQPLPAYVKRYVRIEAIGMDGRRAFSNPVYLG